MQQPITDSFERTWIALDKAINGYWESSRCVLTPTAGDTLAIEAEKDAFRVSLRRRTDTGFADRRVWVVRLDDELHNVLAITDAAEKPARRKDVDALNDALWQFHRLAVEDSAAVIRN